MATNHCRNRIARKADHDGGAHLACHQRLSGAHRHFVKALVQSHALCDIGDDIVIAYGGAPNRYDEVSTLAERKDGLKARAIVARNGQNACLCAMASRSALRP